MMEKRYRVIDTTKVTPKQLEAMIFELSLETGKDWHFKSIGYGLGRIVED